MSEFKPHERSLDANWLIGQIHRLIQSATKFSDSSLVIYAALETRNLFERLEFELLSIAAVGTDAEEFMNEIRGRTGIREMNKKYKMLKYRYQSFSIAVTKAIFEGVTLKKFDYKKSEQYCNELSQYIHTYSRMPEDMVFGSDFISSGIKLIEESINYLMTKFFDIRDGGLTYGGLDFKSLTPKVRAEFEYWLKGVDENEEALLERLKEINIRENGGKKTRISFNED